MNISELLKGKQKNTSNFMESVDWNKKDYLKKIKTEKLNVEVIATENNTLMVEVRDYNSSYALSTEYVSDDQKKSDANPHRGNYIREFMYFDFNKGKDEKDSITKVMVDYNGKIIESKKDVHSFLESYNFQTMPDDQLRERLNKNWNMQMAFQDLCFFGAVDLFEEFLDKDILDNKSNDRIKVTVHGRNNEPALYACLGGNMDMIKLLKDRRADFSDSNNGSIIGAAKNGNTEAVGFLLTQFSVDPNSRNNEAIRAAIKNGHVEVVDLLLKHEKFNTYFDDNYLIEYAIKNGQNDIVKLFLKNDRLNMSKSDPSLLELSASYGDVEIFNTILNDRRSNCFREKAMYVAARKGKAEMLKILINDEGIDPTIMDNKSMQLVISSRSVEAFDFMRSNKNVYNSYDRYTALKVASDVGSVHVLNVLSKENIDLSHNNNDSIKSAVRNHQHSFIKMLLTTETVASDIELRFVLAKQASEDSDINTLNLLFEDGKIDTVANRKKLLEIISNNPFDNNFMLEFILNNKEIDPSSDDNYLLKMASKSNKMESMKLLIEKKEVYSSIDKEWINKNIKIKHKQLCFMKFKQQLNKSGNHKIKKNKLQ
jgi:hypothetical protein